jgi:hypothetical protein
MTSYLVRRIIRTARKHRNNLVVSICRSYNSCQPPNVTIILIILHARLRSPAEAVLEDLVPRYDQTNNALPPLDHPSSVSKYGAMTAANLVNGRPIKVEGSDHAIRST